MSPTPDSGMNMDATARNAVELASIAWDPPGPDGTRSATLDGRRDGPRPFTYAFFMPAGFWDPPHSHIADARVFVASGCLRLAYGTEFERDRAARYPAGSYLLVPAGDVHYDGAEEDTILLGVAVGPWSTDYA